MTVYVDDMYKYPMGQYRRMKMSHMIADTDEELHAMAQRIGVARKWFQKGDHYDICMKMRDRAIAYGAVPITLKELGRMIMEKRRERRQTNSIHRPHNARPRRPGERTSGVPEL